MISKARPGGETSQSDVNMHKGFISNMPEFGREFTGDFPVGSKNLLRRTPKGVLSQTRRMLMLVAHLYRLSKTFLRSNGNKKTWSKSEEEYLQ